MSIEPQIADAVGGLDLEAGPLIGQVRRLDRHWIDVTVTDPSIVGRITVSDLVAFDTGAEFLVGMIDSVTLADGHAPDGNGAAPAETGVELRATPVGAFRPSETGGSFTRGASLYPHVGNDCRLLDGDRLTRFMTILADEVPRDERLQLGHYVGGRQAIAVADGNRLFQRHVALLGSTGSGKSWAVALMLERASRLAHSNLIVFDLHGEYGPLTESSHGHKPLARGLRVAGPSDLAGRGRA